MSTIHLEALGPAVRDKLRMNPRCDDMPLHFSTLPPSVSDDHGAVALPQDDAAEARAGQGG